MTSVSVTPKVAKRLDFFREGWYNRVIKNSEMDETLYFCENKRHWTSYSVYFHRGGKDGPLLATCDRGIFSTGAILRFANESQVVIHPKSHLGFSRVVRFTHKQRHYKWKGTGKFTLRDEQGKLVAVFWRKRLAVGKDGQLEICELGGEMVDVIVMTFMMVLYRQRDEES